MIPAKHKYKAKRYTRTGYMMFPVYDLAGNPIAKVWARTTDEAYRKYDKRASSGLFRISKLFRRGGKVTPPAKEKTI